MDLSREEIEKHMLQALQAFLQDLACILPQGIKPVMLSVVARMGRETQRGMVSRSVRSGLLRLLPLCTVDISSSSTAIQQVDGLVSQALGFRCPLQDLFYSTAPDNQQAILEHLQGLQMLATMLQEKVPEQERLQSPLSVLQSLSEDQVQLLQQVATAMMGGHSDSSVLAMITGSR